MQQRKTYSMLLFYIFAALSTIECNKKNRRAKEIHREPPEYQVYTSDLLPSDKQITTFLRKEEEKQ